MNLVICSQLSKFYAQCFGHRHEIHLKLLRKRAALPWNTCCYVKPITRTRVLKKEPSMRRTEVTIKSLKEKALAALLISLAPSFVILLPAPAFAEGALGCANAFDDDAPTLIPEHENYIAQGNAYLDERASSWVREKKCMSCHTVLPYMLSKPDNLNNSQTVQALSQYVTSRMDQWSNARPWYGGNHTQESQSTELILSAQAMTQLDAARGNTISPTTRKVLNNLAQAQLPDGSWDWLNYGLEPWESKGGKVFGSTMAALALGEPMVKTDPQYKEMSDRLRGYLSNVETNDSTPLLQRVSVLWADSALGNILTPARKTELVNQMLALRNPNDGGWNVNQLGPYKKKGSGPVAGADSSDPLATAVCLISLLESGAITKSSSVWTQGVGLSQGTSKR